MEDGKSLTQSEERELEKLEAIVERKLRAFYEVGQALMRIRDLHLYRKEYSTFGAYCQGRWDISRPRAYQLIEYVRIRDNLSTVVDKPVPERQLRPLMRLDPERQKEAWQRAMENAPDTKITARVIEKVVREMAASEEGQTRTEEESHPLRKLKMLWRSVREEDKRKFLEWVATEKAEAQDPRETDRELAREVEAEQAEVLGQADYPEYCNYFCNECAQKCDWHIQEERREEKQKEKGLRIKKRSFEQKFWSRYPRKDGREEAEKIWIEGRSMGELRLAALDRALKNEEWVKNIPPATEFLRSDLVRWFEQEATNE
jgi:hypothetical protein